MNPVIFQPRLTAKISQGFNDDMRSIITFNTPSTPHKGVYVNIKREQNIQTIYRRDTIVV